METNRREYTGWLLLRSLHVCAFALEKDCFRFALFLESAESDRTERFSHYFYLAVSNNGCHSYSSSDPGIPEMHLPPPWWKLDALLRRH